ncbi:MAG: Re/Si-specific NAD(P)(+) transhydrogenase subunit alpha [Bacteroidia bacterium]|nr:Re/Si-specific NAD(P)(+) transhydrogenase subunit alpha [Bacteroidia bacterium]
MIAGILKEAQDKRVVMVPAVVKKMAGAGFEVIVEKGAGEASFFYDADYEAAGAKITDRSDLLKNSDLVLSITPPSDQEMAEMKEGAHVLAQFSPRANPDISNTLESKGVSAFSMDNIPRTSIAQSMDILSSMASLAGYKAVLTAANYLPSYFPMLMTAAGTIPPAKMLVLGAGVAGLQAIATSRRLGATVEAFDVRSAVKEEVQSLGAKFVEVEGATEDKSAGGYAVQQTEEYRQKQAQLIHEKALKADVIITTANIPGRKAPILIKAETVEGMKSGSVIIDLAAATGGNCELTENDKVVEKHGVTIIGNSNLPGEMQRDASTLLANNYFNFIKYVFGNGMEKVDPENEIVGGTHIGKALPAMSTAE